MIHGYIKDDLHVLNCQSSLFISLRQGGDVQRAQQSRSTYLRCSQQMLLASVSVVLCICYNLGLLYYCIIYETQMLCILRYELVLCNIVQLDAIICLVYVYHHFFYIASYVMNSIWFVLWINQVDIYPWLIILNLVFNCVSIYVSQSVCLLCSLLDEHM